tara:strand:+ start:5562 stop:6041 length:480 start_codon:yes stop_codon:yes gene_type:complete
MKNDSRAEDSLEQAEAILTTMDQCSHRLMHIEQELYQANKDLDSVKHDLMATVSAEMYDGKKKWSNAEARKSEVERRAKGNGNTVAKLMHERDEMEFSLRQAERHLKFHYKVVDLGVSRNLSLMPSIVDIQEYLFQTLKGNIAELLMGGQRKTTEGRDE